MFIVGLVCLIVSLQAQAQQIIDLGYTRLLGNSTTPTGVRKWQRHLLWSDVFDARNWGNPCIQKPASVGVGSEDCLNLAIWKPTNLTRKSKLPVAIYIHGGGFYANAPKAFPLYDWVSHVTYRLGLFGFLGGQAPNAGLLDQRAAMEWVQRHIAKFGGDPDQVTIYGESAGGASVLMQVVAYGGTQKPPFRRAVTQSIGENGLRPQPVLEAGFNGLTQTVNSAMDCLRAAPVESLISAINTLSSTRWDPSNDGAGPTKFLPDFPSRLPETWEIFPRRSHGCFAVGKPEDFVTENDIRTRTFSRWPYVTNDTMTEAIALYSPTEFPTVWDQAWTLAGEILYECLDFWLADTMVKHGIGKAFAFRWNAANTVQYNLNPYIGVGHTSDLYFLMDGISLANAENTFTPFNETEAAVSREAIAFWTSFAINGNPSTSRLPLSPKWTGFDGGRGKRMRMVVTQSDKLGVSASGMEEIDKGKLERCEFWMRDDVVEETRI
ncbi:Alpha/Beta hydrolase protein [Flagelloscypha sp. PMI_526]|nr:Alpha/Beta hydrolase protein [Flagelloscypha sp. PMI_526]